MIKCFIVLCLVSAPNVCQPELEITPADHPITSPMECARGAFIYTAQPRMADNPDTPTTQGNREQLSDGQPAAAEWFMARVRSFMEGDGSDIVRTWVEEEKARAVRLEPQIK
jgi:hypothetical protein